MTEGKGRQWVELIAAARDLSGSMEDQSASADYGSRYGLALLAAARSGTVSAEEAELLTRHGEAWLDGLKRSPARIRASLTSQLRRYRDFPELPVGIRGAFDQLLRELEAGWPKR
jgi:hypothetical protein